MIHYKKRIYEERIKSLQSWFKIVLLTGARQVGKSTILAHLFPGVQTFVFDPIQDLYGARKDPDLFLKNFAPPLILDEIQYVPELLPALKRYADQSDARGQYFLTGSQQLSVLKTVSESLAGRVGILELNSLLPQEIYEVPEVHWLEEYLTDPYVFQKKYSGIALDIPSLYEVIWRGGMPGILSLPNHALPTYFSSYIQTYVDRDVRTLEQIQDLGTFGRFFGLMGAVTGQEINYTQLGRELGISVTTAQRWLNLLQYTYQWHELLPYHTNVIKRVTKKSKGFLSDTGIACYLQRIPSPEALGGAPLLGALFETLCFNMIRTLAHLMPTAPLMYHWRTAGGAEVDIVLEYNNQLYPIEIKCKTNVTGHDTRGIQAFREAYPDKKIMPGLIIYAGDACYHVRDDVIVFPWNGRVAKKCRGLS